MRIAIIIPAIAQAGPVMVMKYLTDELLKNDKFIVKVYYIDKEVDPDLSINVPVERLFPRRFPFDDFDIIHTNGLRPDLFAFLYRKKIKFHISTIHNFVFQDLSFRYTRILSWFFANLWLTLWKRADKLICVSASLRDYYLKWFPSAKLEVIYNGIPEQKNDTVLCNEIFTKANEYHTKGLTVIGVACNLNRGKGIDILLKHMAIANELALVIIGTGPELINLKEMALKLNINDRCYFPGFKTNALNYLKYLDLVIVPSRSEGFCLSLVEAVQQKIPVICSDIDVFKELFDKEEVTFFSLDNTMSLVTALQIAKNNGKSKTDFAYARYRNQYTSWLMAKQHMELYQTA